MIEIWINDGLTIDICGSYKLGKLRPPYMADLNGPIWQSGTISNFNFGGNQLLAQNAKQNCCFYFIFYFIF